MIEYKVDLYKNDEFVRSTSLTVSSQSPLAMEEVAIHVNRLLLVGGYDKECDGFVVYDPSDGPNSQNLYMDLED